MLHADASVEIRVQNITRQDCELLEQVLCDWARRRTNQPLQDAPVSAYGTQLVRGSLQLDVAAALKDGVLTWRDSLVPVLNCQATAAQDDVELLPEGPCYERGTAELLAPAAVDTSLLLPGGTAAAERRRAAEASLGTTLAGGVLQDGPTDTPAPKRQRVSMNTCHNCGSYKHVLSKCPVPVDQRRVAAAMAELRAERGPTNDPLLQMRARYFGMPGAAAQAPQQQAPACQPGSISQELAQALGMASVHVPPPWLGRMVALGVPPKYAQENADDTEVAEDDVMVWHTSSEGESEDGEAASPAAAEHTGDAMQQAEGLVLEPGDAAAATGPAAASMTAEADCNGSMQAEAPSGLRLRAAWVSADVLADVGGTCTAASAASMEKHPQPGKSEGQDIQQPLPPGTLSRSQQQAEQDQLVSTVEQWSAGVAETAVQPAAAKAPKWIFPGVNAGVPAGADQDAWTQALVTGAWLQQQLS